MKEEEEDEETNLAQTLFNRRKSRVIRHLRMIVNKINKKTQDQIKEGNKDKIIEETEENNKNASKKQNQIISRKRLLVMTFK